jgi:hypothetical protein
MTAEVLVDQGGRYFEDQHSLQSFADEDGLEGCS